MSDEKKLREHAGVIVPDNGPPEFAYMVHADGEECMSSGQYRRDQVTTWKGDDGITRIRKGQEVRAPSTSVGASRAYSARYDEMDWSN